MDSRALFGSATLTAALVVIAPQAHADPAQPATDEPVAPKGTILAPTNALELQFHLGYTQPFGQLSKNVATQDVAGAGFGSGGALAWRINPHFGLAGFGAFHHSKADASLNGGMVFGLAGGLRGDYHFLPYRLVDPYVDAGAGYRLLFVHPGGPPDNHMLHGFEPFKGEVGVDFRVTKDFAIGPMIGADVNVFTWDLDEHTGVNDTIAQKGVSTWFFAGVSGKMDVLGKRVAASGAVQPTPAAGPPEEREVKPETGPVERDCCTYR